MQNINIQKIYNIGPMNHLTLEQNYAFNATHNHTISCPERWFWVFLVCLVQICVQTNQLKHVEPWSFDHLCISLHNNFICHIPCHVAAPRPMPSASSCGLCSLESLHGQRPAQHRLRSKKSTEPSGAATGRAGAELLGVKEDFLGIFPLGKAACAIGSTPILP